jgi:anaerobic magnesium-protoporphyrin IX monomethyl ester cyclase
MKIQFVRPHTNIPSAPPPVGFISLIAYLRKFENHEYNILDARSLMWGIDKVKSSIKSYNPDIVCLTAFSTEKAQAHEIANAVKEMYPHIPVIIGGPYPASNYQDALENASIDYAVIGEGEVTFLELVRSIEAGISIRK